MSAEQRPLDDLEIAREESLKNVIGALEAQLAVYHAASEMDTTGESEALLEQTRGALLSAEADWSAFRRELSTKYPVSEGQSYSLERIQATLTDHAAIVGWVEVQTEPQAWDIWAYAIRSEGPVAWAACEDAASGPGLIELRSQLVDPESSFIGVMRDASAACRGWLAPIEHALAGVDELVIVPSGQMLGIPVEAFVGADQAVSGEKYSVSYAPSATVFSWLEERSVLNERDGSGADVMLLIGDPPFTQAQLDAMTDGSGKFQEESVTRATGAGSAFPRLLASRAEVEQLAELTRESTVLLGPDASEQTLVELARSDELAHFDFVHMATHAVVDDERPDRSSLVLCQVDLPDPLESALSGTRIYDGFLTAEEIVREWDLNASLVTLSACETGLGRRAGGEGYIGFAHAFLQVGARSLVVGLWKVDDEATSLLMRRFYENLMGAYEGHRAGYDGASMSKADALQEAKLWLRGYQDESGRNPFRHPCYWAAFILMGDRE
jgi:CHAT domain-containing protein